MKLSYKLGAAALATVAGVALVIPNTTNADSSLAGTGHIKFSYTSAAPTVPDPTRTNDTSFTQITSNETLPVTDPGEFGIVAVTPLEFGSHSSVTAQSQRDYAAQAYSANGGAFTTANFVQFQDYRSGAVHNYAVKAQITTPFQTGTTASDTLLNGATIQYSNTTVKYQDLAIGTGLEPANVSASTTLPSGTAIGAAGDSKVFVNNNGGTSAGYGAYALVFGAAAPATSVSLNIPTASNASVASGDYNAVITWTLSETVQ